MRYASPYISSSMRKYYIYTTRLIYILQLHSLYYPDYLYIYIYITWNVLLTWSLSDYQRLWLCRAITSHKATVINHKCRTNMHLPDALTQRNCVYAICAAFYVFIYIFFSLASLISLLKIDWKSRQPRSCSRFWGPAAANVGVVWSRVEL